MSLPSIKGDLKEGLVQMGKSKIQYDHRDSFKGIYFSKDAPRDIKQYLFLIGKATL